MELNNCFNSPTCTSITQHFVGMGSPAETLLSVTDEGIAGFARVTGQPKCQHYLPDMITRDLNLSDRNQSKSETATYEPPRDQRGLALLPDPPRYSPTKSRMGPSTLRNCSRCSGHSDYRIQGSPPRRPLSDGPLRVLCI